jgi:hypothetical protein
MLGSGFFPMGSDERGDTNQCLAQHDLAHCCAFISRPEYMKAIRQTFQKIRNSNNPNLHRDLENFDSMYSVRLYYMIEVFVEISDHQKLERLLNFSITEELNLGSIIEHLKKIDEEGCLYFYLHTLYAAFPSFSNALGGETRDIINRVRKFYRPNGKQQHVSKFHGSSLWYMYQHVLSLLKNVRKCHQDYEKSIIEHAKFIGALIGTSQLSIEDWVVESGKYEMDTNSKLYKYICLSGIFDECSLLYNLPIYIFLTLFQSSIPPSYS